MSHPHVERRTEAYNFRSLRELITYYSDFMPMGRIEQCVRESAQIFSARREASREQERLQFIGRCEQAIKADLVLLREAFARKSTARPAGPAPAERVSASGAGPSKPSV